MTSPTHPTATGAGLASLRVGFVPLTDAAPLIAAQELGLFRAAGLAVDLIREVGWATVREKIIYGELDAAHAPAPMLWDAALGISCVPRAVLTALVLNLHGNAITLSNRIRAEGTDAKGIKKFIRARNGERRATFGVVFPFSSHHVMLRTWLRAMGVNPDTDVRVVVVPPAQMFRNLAAGTIDGYCAGEPWNSLAIREGLGWSPAWSATYAPGHVEKVLMVTEGFAMERATTHHRLIRALGAAAAWCDEPQNRERLAEILARPQYLNLAAKVILPALTGRFETGLGPTESVPDFHVFSRGDAGIPTVERAEALQRDLEREGILPAGTDPTLPRRLFREDIFRNASQHQHHELVPSTLAQKS